MLGGVLMTLFTGFGLAMQFVIIGSNTSTYEMFFISDDRRGQMEIVNCRQRVCPVPEAFDSGDMMRNVMLYFGVFNMSLASKGAGYDPLNAGRELFSSDWSAAPRLPLDIV